MLLKWTFRSASMGQKQWMSNGIAKYVNMLHENGHLEVLQWAREMVVPNKKLIKIFDFKISFIIIFQISMNISNDIVLVIFSNLPITDKRNLTRTCKRSHKPIRPPTACHQRISQNDSRNRIYLPLQNNILDSLCKFTIELLFDGYAHLIPKRYIIKQNDMLYKYEKFILTVRDEVRLTILNY